MNRLTPLEYFMESIRKNSYYIGDDMVKAYWDAREMEKKMIDDAFYFYEDVQSKIIKRDYDYNLTDQFFKEKFNKI